MKKIIISSIVRGAGKTSVIVGLAKTSGKTVGYLKPLGDRLLYQHKRQLDYDSSIMSSLVGIQENTEDITMGFNYDKLRYLYDENKIQEKLTNSIEAMADQDILFIESGKNLPYGLSVNLDAISLMRFTGAKLFVITCGTADEIHDDVAFLKNHLGELHKDFGGLIINKVHNKEEFENKHLDGIKKTGLDVVGVIPFINELTFFSAGYLADKLLAKVIAGGNNLNRQIQNIVVGATSADAAINLPGFNTANKLVITSGDRSDMILAALESNTSAILLTNNLIPPANIISRATETDTPLLLVHHDTHEAAKQVDNLEPLITKDDRQKADLLETLMRDHLNLEAILD